MSILGPILTLTLIAAASFAVLRAQPASPPHGRRLSWIVMMLLGQFGALYGFLALSQRSGWGLTHAVPPGLAVLTQVVRFVLLLEAGRAWFGLVRPELAGSWRRFAVAGGVLAIAFGRGPAPALGAVALFVGLERLKWIEGIAGWRRALGLLVSVILLAGLLALPITTVTHGIAHLQFSIFDSRWPPALLVGDTPAASEMMLIRPLDRAIQAIVDVFRVQLAIAVIKFLMLPIRLSGMSLKRRFMINFALVRYVPSLLSALVLAGLSYLGLGYVRASHVRTAFEQTLTRAATAAAALQGPATAERGFARGGVRDIRGVRASSALDLAVARQWLGRDGARAQVVVRDTSRVLDYTTEAPAAILETPLVIPDSLAHGLHVRGDAFYLAAGRRAGTDRTVELWIPVDASYLAGVMADVGGNATILADPHVFVGGSGLRISGDTSWAADRVEVRVTEPVATAGHGRPWFLNRTYLPAGDWSVRPGREWRGGIELRLESTPRSLLRRAVHGLTGLYSSLFLVLIVMGAGSLLSIVEGYAVRSGRSIVQAVLDEVGALRAAADQFGAGNLDYRLPVTGRDELSVLATSFNGMAASLERQRQELVAAERLEEDVAVAREIQQRFLPQQAPGLAGLDVAGVSIPSKEVGGDLFYWFSHDDGSLGFALGDVSGKSVSAALLMSNVLAALRIQALERVELSASLERTNRLIVDQIEPGRFVTLFYGEADPIRAVLRYASAGHNPPLLLRANGDVAWLREGGVPLGVLPDARYATASVPFGPGDSLVVYSDGVTEAEGQNSATPPDGSGRELFGEARLETLSRTLRGLPARTALEGILEAVRGFANGIEQADDITIVVVRRTA